MKHVLLALCLSGAIVSAPTALDFTPELNVHDDDVVSASPSSPLQATEIVGLPSEQDEVHAVVVDTPQVISLAYASPETWAVYRYRLNRMSNLRQHQGSSLPRMK
jgi:hypothetical protein